MGLLHCDTHEHKLYLEIRIYSDFELLLNEEEIVPFVQPKPKLLPETSKASLFDVDYIPPSADDVKPVIKTEPSDNTNIIGHITSRPPHLAKQIKQEVIETAAHNVL